jgi:hypothetical protein
MSRRATILIGGRRRDSATFWERINKKAKALESALRPKKKKQLKPGEERQLLLPGMGPGLEREGIKSTMEEK